MRVVAAELVVMEAEVAVKVVALVVAAVGTEVEARREERKGKAGVLVVELALVTVCTYRRNQSNHGRAEQC